ncbi:MAG: hypothetical protein A3J00_01900 [Candidatus Niyogibacteria bacterium RIFCSPLOWO2_02_FULL_45_13]|uniref:Uncharacterized protein n=1 Tax=Candidatus Niyogibacteria bacterium RIFCSPLOWO2_02_FULL_45_13 TaxID=1801725 RepID=A0A1G2EZ09_9BACT|nr:MAG: hypothetical protein A3J00_01900 [Candidatus Niyogibacteria bacterium RIFCSPLOWO2_02_FULL_45_13]
MISMRKRRVLAVALEAAGVTDEKVDRLIDDLRDAAALEPVREGRAKVVIVLSFRSSAVVATNAPMGEPWYDDDPTEEWGEDHARD